MNALGAQRLHASFQFCLRKMAANSSPPIALPDRYRNAFLQHFRQASQGFVTGLVPEHVIDILEFVDIDQRGRTGGRIRRCGDFASELAFKRHRFASPVKWSVNAFFAGIQIGLKSSSVRARDNRNPVSRIGDKAKGSTSAPSRRSSASAPRLQVIRMNRSGFHGSKTSS